ncbi:MAG: putative Ig domain-containing protein, partial [Acidimicrobiia bacterium]
MARHRGAVRRFSTLVIVAALIGSLLATSFGGRVLAASGSCFLVGEPLFHHLSVTDLSDTDPVTNEATIGWSSNSHVGPAVVQPGTGVLFAVESPKLGTVNTGTGDFTPLSGGIASQTGALGPQNLDDVSGVAFDPTSGTLFGVARYSGAGDLLFQIDPDTGNTVDDAFGPGIGYVEIVSDEVVQEDFYGLAIDAGGQMRAVGYDGISQWKLHEVNKADGAAVTGVDSSEVADLSHDAAGNLWGISGGGTLFELFGAEPSRPMDNFPVYSAVACSTVVGNLPPTLDPIGNQSGPEGSPIGFDASATDPDLPAQTLVFSLDGSAPGHSLPPTYAWNATTGVFSWTPSESQGGDSHTFVVVVTDNGAPVATDTETITVSATETNQDPVLGAIGNQSGPEGSPIGFDASATDPDLPAQTLVFSL